MKSYLKRIIILSAVDVPESNKWKIKINNQEYKIIEHLNKQYAISDSFSTILTTTPINLMMNALYHSNMPNTRMESIMIYLSQQTNFLVMEKMSAERVNALEEKINQINDKLELLLNALDLYRKN